MLSDSSNSDTSPIKNKRTSLKIQETSESEDDHESPIVKRKTLIRRRVSSSSDSSGSCIVGPSHKKTKVIPESESESCSSSSDSEVEEVFRPWSTKRPKSRSLLQSDSGSSSEEYSSNGKQSKTKENGDQSSDSDDSEKCIICFKAFRGVIAHPSGCTHNFHSECLLTWSKTSNTCPIDRVKYTEVIVTGIHGEVTRHDVVTPPPQDHNNDIEPDDTTFCEVCNQHDRENEMLLCDRCEAGYHLDCLNPPLEEVPIGDWFCPDCTSLRNDIGDDEVRDLLRGTILIESRLRGRPIVDRPPRIGPRTRAAQRVISSIREMANQNELSQPSVSTSRRTTNKQNRRVNKKRRRKRTHYNVELITTESGATIEVKVAVNTRKRRKKKRRRSCKGHSKAKSTFGKMALSKNLEAANNNNSRRNLNELAVQPLDIFGSRPQLEYFSGCEAEDEFDEEGGGGLGLLRMRSTVIRSMANRKQLAAQVLRSAPRRPIPTVGLATAPPDLISSILNQQEKWHSPNAVIKSNSKGEVKVALHGKSNNIPVKKSVGSEGKTSSTSGTNNQNLSKEGTATPQQSNGESGESVPPLQPPPQPLFSRAYDDEDFDLYADIEAPVEPPLAPPPEPPALLLAMEGDEAASSPEDAMLVIDDRQTYDPDIPTSPPPSPEKPEDNMEIDLPEVTDNRPSMNISSAQIPLPPRIPSPTNEDDIDDCPNRVMYSEASVNIARETKSDSEAEELDVSKSNVPINIIIDTAKNVNQKQNDPDNLSDTDINILDDGENTVVTGDNEDLKDDEYVGEDMIDVSECNITEKKETETCENPNIAAVSECNLDMSDEDCSAETESNSKKLIIGESLLEENSTFESKKHDESDTDDDRDVNIDLEKISEEENISPKEQLDDHQSSSQVNLKDDSPTLSVDEKDKESDDAEIVKVIGSESGDEVERKCQDGWSRESSPSRKVIAEKDEGERKCHDDWSRESSPKRRIIPEKDEGEDVLELGCGDDERDGLVDITDEEISTYEKSWELEDNNAPTKNTVGIEGLETEAISDCEYNIAEDGQPTRANVDNGPKEEGEIITEERKAPVAWKKISKSTKERSYREKEASTFKEKTKKKEKKPKEKRKELERYDVRKIISDKPKKRKVDEFGRDISPSRSRSLSDSRSRSRSVSRRRSRSRSVKKRRSRDRRSRNRSIAKSRGRSRPKSRDKSRKRSRGRSKSRSRSGSKRRRSRSPRKNKERRSRAKSKEKKRRKRESSISCSSCSCSSCEQERRKSKKLTVIVPNKPLAGGSTKEKKKGKYKDRTEGKRRRVDSPVPSKEVFTSGDNILVSVNFKSSKSGETSRKEPSKKKKDEETKKKKDKGSKENQPLRSIVSKSSSNQQGQKKGKINSKNLKPVAIIDLAQSPFREQTLSPKEIIVLTDSDSDDKRKPDENNIPSCQVTGPKTPPEPHIKFNIINSKPQMLRSLVNPLLDSADQLEGDVDDDEDDRVEIPHKGPNTPPEPPVPYDPFEPTKSRSPTPLQELEESRNATPPTEKNLPIDPPQRPITPPKPLPESPKTPSPLHSPPPKPAEESTPEKAHLSPPNDCNDDSMDIGGGDSPYSPGSSEADDLFDAPTAMNTSTPIAKVKPRQIQQKHPQKLSSPLKRKPGSSKLASKNSKANNKKEASKLDEDQLKILDDLPNSAVEMQVKDKFLKKLNRQERVVEEVKMVLKPHYAKKHVTKEEYKDILRKSVPKICHSRSGEINPMKIQRLIEAYVKKYRHLKKKRKPATFSAPESLQPLKPKGKQTLWC